MEGFSLICGPLTDNLKKGIKFDWTEPCQKAFEVLKGRFSSAPILAHFNPDCDTKIETDTCNFAKIGVLSQIHSTDSKWHPVAFYSKKFSSAECNYDIHDKELGAIVASFEEWS